MPKKLTTTDWVEKATIKHNNKYDYTNVEYINAHTPVVITCPQHGAFSMRPNDHTNGQGCRECGIIRRNASHRYDTDAFIERAKAKHGEHTYNYDLVNYISSDRHVTIICPKHGMFDQRPNRHLFGDGCPLCARERAIFDGYSTEYFNRYPEECLVPAQLYVVRFDHLVSNDMFIKIGITKNTLRDRYHYGYAEFSITPVIQVTMPLKQAFDVEQMLLNKLSEYKHSPVVVFGGYTECVSIDALPLLIDWVNSILS